MWSGDDRHGFIEFHSWYFLSKASSISALLILHPTILEQNYIRGLSRKPGDRLLRFSELSGSEEKGRNPEFHGTPVVHMLRDSIPLQPNTVCIGKAHSMEMETVSYNRSNVHWGTAPTAGQSGYEEWR